MTDPYPTMLLPTLDQSRSRRGDAPTVVEVHALPPLHPADLAEIEAGAQRGMPASAEDVVRLVDTIKMLSRRVADRFGEAADARDRAMTATMGLQTKADTITSLNDRIRELAGALELERAQGTRDNVRIHELVNELEEYRRHHVCTDGCRPNAHIAFTGKGLVAELQQSVAARDRLLAEATRVIRSVHHVALSVEIVAAREDNHYRDRGYFHLVDAIREIRGILGDSSYGPADPPETLSITG